MSLRETFPKAHLPSTHYFITIARGQQARTLAMPALSARAAVGLIALAGVWCLAVTLYLAFHDDLMAGLMAHQTELQYAYEDRLASLRNELDRVSSRQLLDQNSFEGKVHVMLSRQAQLEARASMIEAFADEVGLARHAAAAPRTSSSPFESIQKSAATGAPSSILPAEALGYTPAEVGAFGVPDKPRPEADEGRIGPTSDNRAAMPRLAATDMPVASQLAYLSNTLDRIEGEQLDSLSAIGRNAQRRLTKFNAALATAGLSANRFAGSTVKGAEGGPFVPMKLDPNGSPFEHAVYDLRESLDAADRLQQILPSLPLRRPYAEAMGMTSGFGPRTDPFNGRLAMHTGVDFAMEMGAPVRATAAGRVTVAGPEGGYGNMVEIDHGHGLSTRYAHLSAISVEVGQKVETGTVIGNVGATGRATGPHLHYETRIDGEAVDPLRFLRAGQQFFATP